MPIQLGSGIILASGAAFKAYDMAKTVGVSDEEAERWAIKAEHEAQVRKETKKV